jgi:hypothetical protein
MDIQFKINSWGCDCGYVQDFDPSDEDMMMTVFGKDVNTKICPSCKKREGLKHLGANSRTFITCSDDDPKIERYRSIKVKDDVSAEIEIKIIKEV